LGANAGRDEQIARQLATAAFFWYEDVQARQRELCSPQISRGMDEPAESDQA
jgi:hypothetical protein